MTIARAKALLSWCLSVLPEDPPSQDLSGWTRAMREEWDAKRDEIRDLIDEIDEDSAAHGGQPNGRPGNLSRERDPFSNDRADRIAAAAPAGSPERAAQIERTGLPLDPEKPRRLCAVCLSPDHNATLCEWNHAV